MECREKEVDNDACLCDLKYLFIESQKEIQLEIDGNKEFSGIIDDPNRPNTKNNTIKKLRI